MEDGIIKKVPYGAEGKRFQYRLTQKGLEMAPILFAMADWEERFNPDPAGSPQRYWHALCGKETTPKVVCFHCDEPFTALNISVEFLSEAAMQFALQHCADPGIVEKN